MTLLDINLDEKQPFVEGTLTQAKGVIREQWGQVTDNDLTRLGGKKDQVVGHLQAKYGNKWLVRHGRWVLFVTIATLVCTALAFIFIRSNTPVQES